MATKIPPSSMLFCSVTCQIPLKRWSLCPHPLESRLVSATCLSLRIQPSGTIGFLIRSEETFHLLPWFLRNTCSLSTLLLESPVTMLWGSPSNMERRHVSFPGKSSGGAELQVILAKALPQESEESSRCFQPPNVQGFSSQSWQTIITTPQLNRRLTKSVRRITQLLTYIT